MSRPRERSVVHGVALGDRAASRYLLDQRALFHPRAARVIAVILVVVLSFLIPTKGFAKRFPSSYSSDVRKAIEELQSGIDEDAGVFPPYSEWRLQQLVEGLQHPSWEVKEVALITLEQGIKEWEFPQEIRQAIRREMGARITPILEQIQRDYQDSGDDSPHPRLLRLARQVSWQLRVHTAWRIDRLTMLLGALNDWTDGYYYPVEAIDQLAQMGTPMARAVLEETLRESQEHSMDSGVVEELPFGIKRMDMLQELSALDPEGKVARLMDAIGEYEKIYGLAYAERRFLSWTLELLLGMDHPAATQALVQIWTSENYDATFRYKAQEALVRRGLISPERRTIYFAE